MELRRRIAAALDVACAEGQEARSATLRLLMAAIRDRELARAAGADAGPLGDAELQAMLTRLAAQRRASAAELEQEGRLQQAAEKAAEAEVIEGFLPRRMPPAEVEAAIDRALDEVGARSLRDIGRAMAVLRPRLADHMPPAELKRRVRARLDPPGVEAPR